MKNSLLKLIFFGNYFYGLCAVALTIEASLQQQYPLNEFTYFLGVFAITVWYYTLAYSAEPPVHSSNPRSAWYSENVKLIKSSQWVTFIVCVFLLLDFLRKNGVVLLDSTMVFWILILIFPLAGIFYYGVQYRIRHISLRTVGWMKPFVIGFVWAGLVTVYPVLYYGITHGITLEFSWVSVFLFLKNFMFITVLAIMFDIKDYADDSNMRLKTYVVNHGLRKTIFYILIPLSVAGLGTFLWYGYTRHFSGMKIFLNTIPFLVMFTVAYGMHKRQSILYYLVLIDGLMLIKAICGTIAMSYF